MSLHFVQDGIGAIGILDLKQEQASLFLDAKILTAETELQTSVAAVASEAEVGSTVETTYLDA